MYTKKDGLTKKEIGKLQRRGTRLKRAKAVKKQLERMQSNYAIINKLLKEYNEKS